MSRNHTKRRNAPRAKKSGDGGPVWLWGTHAVMAAMTNPKRHIQSLRATENAARRTGLSNAEIVTARQLDAALPASAVHQGLALLADPLPPASLDDILGSAPARIAVLDQVSDPHNLGAIFRSAAAFGVSALVLQSRNAPPITGIVAKSAAGAIETVTEARVVNIARAVDQLGEAGYHTVGLAGEGASEIAAAITGAPRLAIVLGAEGAGLRPAVAKACAELARIPIAADMESLNVSNAATIAFYEAARELFAAG